MPATLARHRWQTSSNPLGKSTPGFLRCANSLERTINDAGAHYQRRGFPKRTIQATWIAVLACFFVLTLLVVGAECFLKEDEAFSVSVRGSVIGIGPWFRTGHGFSQTKRVDVCSDDGTGVTVTLRRRGWLVWILSLIHI